MESRSVRPTEVHHEYFIKLDQVAPIGGRFEVICNADIRVDQHGDRHCVRVLCLLQLLAQLGLLDGLRWSELKDVGRVEGVRASRDWRSERHRQRGRGCGPFSELFEVEHPWVGHGEAVVSFDFIVVGKNPVFILNNYFKAFVSINCRNFPNTA